VFVVISSRPSSCDYEDSFFWDVTSCSLAGSSVTTGYTASHTRRKSIYTFKIPCSVSCLNTQRYNKTWMESQQQYYYYYYYY